jgi:hypothetical protein
MFDCETSWQMRRRSFSQCQRGERPGLNSAARVVPMQSAPDRSITGLGGHQAGQLKNRHLTGGGRRCGSRWGKRTSGGVLAQIEGRAVCAPARALRLRGRRQELKDRREVSATDLLAGVAGGPYTARLELRALIVIRLMSHLFSWDSLVAAILFMRRQARLLLDQRSVRRPASRLRSA